MEWIKLTNEEIDRVAEEMIDFFTKNKIDKKDITRNRLLLEEILFKYQMRFGEDCQVRINLTRMLGQIRCYVYVPGEAYNPLESDDDDIMSSKILSSLLDYEGGTPNWTYRNGANTVFIMTRHKRKVSLIAQIIVALVAGALLGYFARRFLDPAFTATLITDYLQPLANAYTGILCVMAVLLTFFAFPLGISSIGNAHSVGKLTGKSILRMYIVMLICTVLYFIIFSFRATGLGAGSIGLAGKALFDIIIGFFPTGLVTPFIDFNSIQILIIGMMFGFSFLAMGEKGQRVIDIFDSCNLAAILTNNFLNMFIPYYVAVCVFTIIANADLGSILSVPQILIFTIAGFLLLMAFYTIFISIKYKVSPFAYLKKLLPTFIICLSSGSFGAAFTTGINTALGFNTDVNTTTFIFNIGGVTFKPAHSITFLVSSVILAGVYGVEITLPWLIFALLLSIILTVAVPNVPGASASVYALLFTQLGLPNNALVLMISINAFLEFLLVAVNVFCLQSECVIQGCEPGKIKM